MDKNLLIEIFVPSDDGTEQGRIGTGYPIGDGLILTAGHILGSLRSDAGVSVRWHHQKNNPAGKWQSATVKWPGTADLDAAVLSCDFHDAVKGCCRPLSRLPPATHQKWESEGFPAVGARDDGSRAATPMWGTVAAAADSANRFTVGAEYPTSLPDGWRGASGSPVFVGNMIMGVVVTCPAHFDQTRLEATPAWKLFENEDFRKLLPSSLKDPHRDDVCAVILGALERFSSLKRLVLDVMQWHPMPSKDMAEALLDVTPIIFLQKFRIIANKIEGNAGNFSDSGIILGTICDIVFRAVPVMLDGAVVNSLMLQKQGVFSHHPSSIAQRTVAELGMARVDGREARFRGSDFAGGIYEIPDPPDGGLENWGENFDACFNQHLVNELAAGFGCSEFSPEAQGIISELLENRTEINESRYYCINSRNIADKNLIHAKMKMIKDSYPSLFVIRLSEDAECRRSEIKIIDNMAYFISLFARS